MEMITLVLQGRRYGMRKMPPMQGARFTARVMSLVSKIAAGEGALKSFEALKTFLPDTTKPAPDPSKKEEVAISTNEAISIGSTLLGLLSNINADELMDLLKEAFSYEVYCEETKLSDEMNFDIHFQKFPGDLYIVAVWVTYNQAKDFFTGFGDGIKALTSIFVTKKV